MRRLGRHVKGKVAGDGIQLGSAAARLDGRNMNARDVNILLDGDIGAL